MKTNEFETMNDAYYAIYERCRREGEASAGHRMGECVELRPYAFTLKRPHEGLFTGAPRRLNYRFWAAETLCYIAGWGEEEAERCAELLTRLNSNYANFSRSRIPVGEEESRVELMPMVRYGDALGPGLVRCYDTLAAKPLSRQAYVSIHNRDTPHDHQELPCGASVQFVAKQARGGLALDMLCHIRSNDLGWGVPYDVASNCAILLAMSGALGMAAGEYHHVAGSMHYYREGHGSGPPNVQPHAEETWLSDPPLMPNGLHVCDFRRYRDWAHALLLEMHHNFVEHGKPGHSLMAPSSLLGNPWVEHWVRVARWRHPRRGE